jgi:PAS domain S-box-containing protein
VDGATAATEARLQALLNAIPDLMLRLREDGTYLDFAGDTTRLAHSAETIVGTNAWDILPDEVATELMSAVRRALQERRLARAVYRLTTVAGDLRDFEARVVPSADDEVVVIVRDVTDLNRSVQQLRESRRRIARAAEDERHRLERNLHDGAQQRLIALSHHLHLVGKKLDDDPAFARRLLRSGQDELAAALEEIRELVRGLHPSVLTRCGLRTALGALAARMPMTVELSVTDERLAPEIEAAAYYVVAEALANAAKHAACSRAGVAVSIRHGRLKVDVADDGRGGADPRGSGLRGLCDRVEAVGGSFEVLSPPSEGTRIRADIPLAEAAL